MMAAKANFDESDYVDAAMKMSLQKMTLNVLSLTSKEAMLMVMEKVIGE